MDIGCNSQKRVVSWKKQKRVNPPVGYKITGAL
jgi:hypothetical protein